MDQQTLEDIAAVSQVQPAHATGIICVSDGSLHPFCTTSAQDLAAISLDPASIRIYRGLLISSAVPLAASPIRF